MAGYVPLAQQQSQFVGGKPAKQGQKISGSLSTGSGYVPLAQQHQTFLKTNPVPAAKKVTTFQSKPTKVSEGGLQMTGAVRPGTKPPVKTKENPIQTFFRGAVNQMDEATFADKYDFFTPLGFTANIAQGTINTPKEAAKGVLSLIEHKQSKTSTPKQIAGDIAAAVQLPLLFFTGGTSTVAKQGIKETVKTTIKQGGKGVAKSAAKEGGLGAIFGAITGFQTGENIKDNASYYKNLEDNILMGAGLGLGFTAAANIALPLAKGLSSALGSIFLKKPRSKNATPVVEHIQLDPKVAQSTILGNEKLANSLLGKKILSESLEAQKTGKQIAITPDKNGAYQTSDGKRVKVYLIDRYNPTKQVESFENNIDEYRRFGGRTDATPTENAALRDIETLASDKDVIKHTQEKVKKAMDSGELIPDKDGKITLYRGGKPSQYNNLVSASYNKDVAKQFVRDGEDIYEFKVKPEEIKALIGRSEAEVLVDKQSMTIPAKLIDETVKPTTNEIKITKKKTEDLTGEYKTERAFDKKGNEITDKRVKVFNSKEAKAVQKVVTDQLDEAGLDAKSQEDLIEKATKIIDSAIEKAGGERYALSGIRTAVNKEMFKAAGVSDGNSFKAAWAELQTIIKESPEIGDYVKTLLEKRYDIDDALIVAAPKKATAPAVKVSEQIAPPKPKAEKKVVKKADLETFDSPVGTGKLKNSRFFERLKESFNEETPDEIAKANPQYKVMNREESAFNAVRIASEDPQRATRIASGLEKVPDGMTATDMRKTLAAIAREKGDWESFNKWGIKASLAGTRYGQEIVSFRGKKSDHNPLAYVDQIVKQQKEMLLKKWDKVIVEEYGVAKDATVDKKISVLIEKQTEKLKVKLTAQQKRIQSAQSIMDALKCK